MSEYEQDEQAADILRLSLVMLTDGSVRFEGRDEVVKDLPSLEYILQSALQAVRGMQFAEYQKMQATMRKNQQQRVLLSDPALLRRVNGGRN